MTISAKIILDSIAPNGVRITTSELTYPRMIHAELMTHRVFSRNAASSRAIPTPKKIERIRKDCAKPSEWGVNVKGMQSAGALGLELAKVAEGVWLDARDKALHFAEILCGLRCASCQNTFRLAEQGATPPLCPCGAEVRLDLHKQVANRILEPFDHICTVVTTTKLNNHRKLRTEVDPLTGRPMPDPTYYELATKWHAALDASTPRLVNVGDWHLPYVYNLDGSIDRQDADAIDAWFEAQGLRSGIDTLWEERLAVLKKVSVGRVARTSYMRSGQGDIAENVVLHDRLASAGHWSPFEAQATPIGGFEFATFEDEHDSCYFCGEGYAKGAKGILRLNQRDGLWNMLCKRCALGHVTSGNFTGWTQYRKSFENEAGGDD